MWKATATLDQNSIKDTIAKKQDDDLEDWDSDPNFVNAVSEKDQRWGRQETCPKEPVNQGQEPIAMEDLRRQVVQNDKESTLGKYKDKEGEERKKSYQTPTKIK